MQQQTMQTTTSDVDATTTETSDDVTTTVETNTKQTATQSQSNTNVTDTNTNVTNAKPKQKAKGPPMRFAEANRTSSCLFADRLATKCLNTFRQLCPKQLLDSYKQTVVFAKNALLETMTIRHIGSFPRNRIILVSRTSSDD